ncbi:PPM-type phosphatase-like domain [Dillenia turbinata]|uniref:PPM-type phosphatase-like domain n=1 Tax=Dillenia turbinata TaxID=194707 RepID=A0AAN8VH01_9MAGN
MGLNDLRLKFKAIYLSRLFRLGYSKKEPEEVVKKPSWMVPVSYGYYVVDYHHPYGDDRSDDEKETDSVVAQREQIEELELWYFGVSNANIGDGVTKYMQSHLFNEKQKEPQIWRKSKETIRKAYLGARTKAREVQEDDETCKAGSASAIVINGEKLVLANMGDYQAVVCRDGEAHQITKRHHHHTAKGHWPRKFVSGEKFSSNPLWQIPSTTNINMIQCLSGVIRMPKVRILGCSSGNAAATKTSKGLELAVGVERVDSDTEFVILASSGIWEVMKIQEAVNLIQHIEDPQEASECLAKEALARMSKGNISCMIIRFD